MRTSSKLLIVVVVIFGICGLVVGGSLLALYLTRDDHTQDVTDGDEDNSSDSEAHTLSDQELQHYSDDLVSENGVLEIYRPEIDLLNETLKLMKNGKNLPYLYDSSNLIRYGDFDKATLVKIKNNSEAYDLMISLPEYATELFTSNQAFDEIKHIVYTAREEYIAMLKDEGVDSSLIRELDQKTFPPDDDHLWVSWTDDLYKEFSFVDTEYPDESNPDHKEAYMRFEMGSGFAWSYHLSRSGIFGAEPENASERIAYWKGIREYGVRTVFYHEMTHVLQMAYANLMLDKYGQSKLDHMGQIDQSMVRFCDDDIYVDIEKTPFTESDNYVIGMETQAVVLGQYMTVKKYSLNSAQAQALWDHVGSGARMANVRRQLGTMMDLFSNADEAELENIREANFRGSLGELFESQADTDMKQFLTKISNYSGIDDQAYAIGYAPEYSAAQVNVVAKNILNQLKDVD